MNKDEMKMIREKCEHFNEEVCSKINCKEGCKYYGTANCDNCIHEDVCYMLGIYNDCKNEVAEYGCHQYQPKVADDEQIVNTEQLNETLNSTLESGKRMGYAQGRDETITAVLTYIDKTVRDFDRINEEEDKGVDGLEKEARAMFADTIATALRIVRDNLARAYGFDVE